MARRYRLEYLRKKREKERLKELKRMSRERWLDEETKRRQKMSDRQIEILDDEDEIAEEDRLDWKRELLSWILYILVVLGATYLIVTYVGQRTEVSGESMLPALHHEDNLIVDKISYRFRDPKRYEIIVFPYKYQEDTYYIKRIIGLPGETVQVIGGEVYINGELLGEDYGLEPIDEDKKGLASEPIKLGEDEYFVLGDNRNHSSDSREPNVGVLHRDELIGRAWIRIWPFDSIGVIPHE